MDKSVLLQKQVRDNSEDLRTYLKDLSLWEEEMKRKESELNFDTSEHEVPSIRKKEPEIYNSNHKKHKAELPKKIKGFDYAAWDKFDADSECEKVDSNKSENVDVSSSEDENESEELNERFLCEAIKEKDKGNKFVQNKKWNEAIACYTHAIACNSKDPIFYANRALCFLKKNDFHSAEADCTSALRLDASYVKALQRRAAARVELNQLQEALIDLRKVLELEPHNPESSRELDKLETRLGIKKNDSNKLIYQPNTSKIINIKTATDKSELTNNFVRETSPKPGTSKSTLDVKPSTEPTGNVIGKIKGKSVEEVKSTVQWPEHRDAIFIKSISKPPHLRSKKTLQRVEITEVFKDECKIADNKSQSCNKTSGRTLAAAQLSDRIAEREACDATSSDIDYSDSSALAKIINMTNSDVESLLHETKDEEKSQEDLPKTKIGIDFSKIELIEEESLAQILKESVNFKDIFSSKSLNNAPNKNITVIESSSDASATTKTSQQNNENAPTTKASLKANTMASVDEKVDDMNEKNLEAQVQRNNPCNFAVPRTSVQFNSNWRLMKNNLEQKYLYLRQIEPTDLPSIFRECLESSVFTEILYVLNEKFTAKNLAVYPYLKALSAVKRFSTLIMFMSKQEKLVTMELFKYCEMRDELNEIELNLLKQKYEL